jgi:hypothetical protein
MAWEEQVIFGRVRTPAERDRGRGASRRPRAATARRTRHPAEVEAPTPQMAPSAPAEATQGQARYQLPTSGARATARPPRRVRNPVTGPLERVLA